MKRTILKAVAVLVVFILVFIPAALSAKNLTKVYAADKPTFSVETQSTNLNTGSFVFIDVYVLNDTAFPITAFNGELSFNNSYLKYIDFTVPTGFRTSLNIHDSTASSENKISFDYSDVTSSQLPAGKAKTMLLSLRFEIVNKLEGSCQIDLDIDACYSGAAELLGETENEKLLLSISTTTSSTTSSTRALSSENRLKSLTVSSGTLSPKFNSDFVAYTVDVDYSVNSVQIAAEAMNSAAIVAGLGEKNLIVGQNSFSITVTAEDGSVMRYGVIFIRASQIEETPIVTPIEGDDTEQSTTTTAQILTTTNTQTPAIIDEENENRQLKTMAIIFAGLALVAFAFLSGFFIDKNIKQKRSAEAQLELLNRQYSQQQQYREMAQRAVMRQQTATAVPPPQYQHYNPPEPQFQTPVQFIPEPVLYDTENIPEPEPLHEPEEYPSEDALSEEDYINLVEPHEFGEFGDASTYTPQNSIIGSSQLGGDYLDLGNDNYNSEV